MEGNVFGWKDADLQILFLRNLDTVVAQNSNTDLGGNSN